MVKALRFNASRYVTRLTWILRVHMGRELMYEYRTFLDNIRSMDKVLQSLKHAPSWSIEGKVNFIN